MKKRIVVICPGRGSYTAETLGYIARHRQPQIEFMNDINARRAAINEPTISEIDGLAKFSPGVHTRGEHASTLIYASSYHDFLNIDREQYEIVAICGNSMGWYLSLAFSGATDWAGSFDLIQTMGSMMKNEIVGAQIVYPIVDDNWALDYERKSIALKHIEAANQDGKAYVSIWLGGNIVIGACKKAAQYLIKNLPKVGDYPIQLLNHAAFHTPLLYETSQRAFEMIPEHILGRPRIPLIDGRGEVWQPYSTDVARLYDYTLGHQVYAPYDFTASVTVAIKEFMPDQLLLLGPGSGLGGVIGQIIVQNKWHGISNKNEFKEHSKKVLITC